MIAGVLSAEREGQRVKFTMVYPPDYDHSFLVERLVVDPESGEEAWEEVHTGSEKFLEGSVGYEYPSPPLYEGGPPVPLVFPRTYRALVHKRVYWPGTEVRVLETDGTYSDPVTVD